MIFSFLKWLKTHGNAVEEHPLFFLSAHFSFPRRVFHTLWKAWKTDFSRAFCRKVFPFWGRKRGVQARNGIFILCSMTAKGNGTVESLWKSRFFSMGFPKAFLVCCKRPIRFSTVSTSPTTTTEIKDATTTTMVVGGFQK